MPKKSKTHFLLILIVLFLIGGGVIALAVTDLRPDSSIKHDQIDATSLTQ